jgi:glycosyltransferase involved in cell wall biosynthesis
MTDKPPLISVIVPAYNAEEFLAEAVRSIECQDYDPLEVILIDDGSTDGTARVAATLGQRLHYFHQPNRGAAAARNTGLRLARGELITFLDADDLWPEGSLRLLLETIGQAPETEVVLGLVQYIRTSQDSRGHRTWEKVAEPTISLNLGAALIRRRVFEKVGFFDETLTIIEDLDWYMRLREHAVPMQVLNQVTLFYRIHARNMSRDRSERERSLMQALKLSLDRRRQKGKAASSLTSLRDLQKTTRNPE